MKKILSIILSLSILIIGISMPAKASSIERNLNQEKVINCDNKYYLNAEQILTGKNFDVNKIP